MTNVVVTIEYGNRERMDLAIPLDVPCRQLAASIGKALNQESDVEQAFVLFEVGSVGVQRLPANITLGAAGIVNGAILRLNSEHDKASRVVPQGGAFLQSATGQIFKLTGAYTLIGRSDSRHNILPDIDLTNLDSQHISSRRHACIEFNQTAYTIMDLGSNNGTWVNGRRLQPKYPEPLNEGDEIMVGKNGVKFSFKRG